MTKPFEMENENHSSLTLDDLIAFVRRSAPIVAVSVATFIILAIAYFLLATRVYDATARVIVEPRSQTVTNNQEVLSGLPQRDALVVDTEVHFLESGAIVERIMRDSDLKNDPVFKQETPEKTAQKMASALDIKRVGMTYMIDIVASATSAEHAALLANEAAKTYLKLQQERKRNATANAVKLLGDRAQKMAQQVDQAEAEVVRFRQQNNLLTVDGTTFAEQSAAQLSDQLATARANEQAALGRLMAAQSARMSTDGAHAQGSLGSLRSQQASAQQEMSIAQSQYGELHPNYIAARQKLDKINQAVAEETARARSAIAGNRQNELAELQAQATAASSLRQSIENSVQAKASTLDHNSQSKVQLGELERRATALRANYEELLRRYQQTNSHLGLEIPDSALVAAAISPLNPSSPKLGRSLAVAILAGIFVGFSISILRMLLEPHFSNGRQIERSLSVVALPALPTLQSTGLFPRKAKPSLEELLKVMGEQMFGAFAGMHRNLLSTITRPSAEQAHQIIAFTSSIPGEGKSTSVACLAAAAAANGMKTLVLDGDLHRADLTRELARNTQCPGLAGYLDGSCSLQEAVCAIEPGGFDLLPANANPIRHDVFSSPRFLELLSEAWQHYDLVLIDTPPVLPVFDSRDLLIHANSVVIICQWRKTSRRILEETVAKITRAGANVGGVALTQMDITQLHKFSDEGHHYSSSYRKYFRNPEQG